MQEIWSTTQDPQVENHHHNHHCSMLSFLDCFSNGASQNCFPPACRGCCGLWENSWGGCWGLRLQWEWTEVSSLNVRCNSMFFSSLEKLMFVVVIAAYLVQLFMWLLKWIFANKQMADIIFICLNTIGLSRKKDTALCLAKSLLFLFCKNGDKPIFFKIKTAAFR